MSSFRSLVYLLDPYLRPSLNRVPSFVPSREGRVLTGRICSFIGLLALGRRSMPVELSYGRVDLIRFGLNTKRFRPPAEQGPPLRMSELPFRKTLRYSATGHEEEP